LVLASECADLELAVALGDVIEIGDAIDVDDVLRRNDAQLHHRDETLAAGK